MDAFSRFVQQHRDDLKRIARATRGEHQYDDVVSEAWLMAQQLSAKHPTPSPFDTDWFEGLLIRHLYQKLVRYTELNVRHAVRLDHAIGDDADGAHPLMDKLPVDDGRDPLSYLLAVEASKDAPTTDDIPPSLAGAWLLLLQRYGNRMRPVAGHLLISLSYAYRCCAQARWFARHQNALRLETSATQLRAWRRHRATRAPRQLEFAFEEGLAFIERPR